MSNGPVRGNNIPPLTIPQGKLVYYMGIVQSGLNQFAQLTDSAGNTLMQMSGSAPNMQTPTMVGSGYFTAQDSSQQYTLGIGIDGSPGNGQVLWSENVISLDNQVRLTQYTFIVEDANDDDYNDFCVIIQWSMYAG